MLTLEDTMNVARPPYMSSLFRPLQAVEMLVPCQNREQPCTSEHSVYWWWRDPTARGKGREQTRARVPALPCCPPSPPCTQDVGIPYIADERHSADTLFLVAESNYRVYEFDARTPWPWPPGLTENYRVGVPEIPRPRPVPAKSETPFATLTMLALTDGDVRDGDPATRPSPAPANPAEPSPAPARTDAWESGVSSSSSGPVPPGPSPAPAWTPVSTACEDVLRVMAEEALQQAIIGGWRANIPAFSPSQELLDVVGMANEASRQGLGHIVWFSWESRSTGKGPRWTPTHGTNFLAIDRYGARQLGRYLESVQPGPFDMILSQWLSNAQVAHEVGASFVWPSCGSSVRNMSGDDDNLQGRSGFGQFYVQEGFRHGRQERWICRFGSTGSPTWVVKAEYDEADWTTQMPPTKWSDDDFQLHLKRKGWLTPEGQWRGPSREPRRATGLDDSRARRSKPRVITRPGFFDPSPVPEPFCPSPVPGSSSPSPVPEADAVPRCLADTYWDDLRRDPDAVLPRWGQRWDRVPITRIALEVVVDRLGFKPENHMDDRIIRVRRRLQALYLRRTFGEMDEARFPGILGA